MKRYNPAEIENKWQNIWADEKIYEANDASKKPKYYALSFFPYPSGRGLHIGHTRNFTITDVVARFKRMTGHEVLHPMGWDSFGLPAENFAIKTGIAPQLTVKENETNFRAQCEKLGLSIDWSREFSSTDPDYYKWTQWFFKLLFEQGLAYQKESPQFWCPLCKTVLANEQVVNGCCWRHEDTRVEKKMLKQWFFKITDYADRLAEDLEGLDWPNGIVTQQRNWIGKSLGAEVDFVIAPEKENNFVILHGYTGRADKNFIPWLKQNLEMKGYEVQAPQLPNTDDPTEKEQVEFVLANVKFDKNTVLIGHSLGGAVAMKVLEKLSYPIKQLVLVAPAIEDNFRSTEYEIDKETGERKKFLTNFDLSGYDYDAIISKTSSRLILQANNDAPDRLPYMEYLSKKIKADLRKTDAEENHFTGDVEPFILDNLLDKITVFTTRPDTLFGATFMVLAPEHPLVAKITAASERASVENYVASAVAKTDLERQDEDREKTGVFTGAYAINPVNGEKIPIWIADYVLMGYGTGAIMAVPAHDERDFAFATKYDLPIVTVIDQPEDASEPGCEAGVCYAGEGNLVNSGAFNDTPSSDAREQIVAWLETEGVGRAKINYKMRDWLISRQRYWGAPIPIVFCEKDGAVALPDEDLPLKLPEMKDYEPSGDGKSPLAKVESWVNTTCSKCGGPARRETDTMDGFACSSWYFLRFADPHNSEKPFEEALADKWLPVDMYVGGAEHAVMHLLYARMWTKVMQDAGLINFGEPFQALRNQGMLLASDGQKISKSKGNTIAPEEVIDSGYGADALRMIVLFLAPFDQSTPWSETGLAGVYRFIGRFWNFASEISEASDAEVSTSDLEKIQRVVNKTIKKVSEDLTNLGFNTAIAALMEALNDLTKLERNGAEIWKSSLAKLTQLLAPFAPHVTEEIWREMLGNKNSIHTSDWPSWDEKFVETDEITIAVQVNGKVRGEITVNKDASENEVQAAALALPNVQNYLGEKEPARVIYVPGRILNIVVK